MMQSNSKTGIRHTKILATLGPSTDQPGVLHEMIENGLSLVRLNFSHGNHDEHLKRIEQVRSIAAELKKQVGLLADLQGPKIRVAGFQEDGVALQEGKAFCLDADWGECDGDVDVVGIDYKALPSDVSAGDILLLDDGKIRLQVKKVDRSKIHCEVICGGFLSSHKGINRLGGGLSAPALTEKDREDMRFALEQEVHYIAISFPRNADDMLMAREVMQFYGGQAGLVAKIERYDAIDHIDDIIRISDAVMVARGDLAVEIGDENVPLIQKKIIKRARALNKPVITATQMMESMIHQAVPTRAEVSDVANAVIDYTDAVMLSAETAVGEHPSLVLDYMSRACMGAEESPRAQISGHRIECQFEHIDEAVAMATMYTANHLNIKAIITLTESGSTPLWMSRIRSSIPIYALCRNHHSLGLMTMYRGVFPIYFDVTQYAREDVNRMAIACLERRGIVESGEQVILTKGDFQGVGGYTNAMKILIVGEVR